MPFQKGNKAHKKAAHTIAASKAREYVINRVVAELDPIITGKIEAAKGLYVEERTKDGAIKRYQKEPDQDASKYLLDQVAGKAKESMDLTSGGKPLPTPIYGGKSKNNAPQAP